MSAEDERLAAFAGRVGHDLRNPLSAVLMSLELARDELAACGEDAGQLDVAELDGMLARAARNAARMDSMIGELVAFARGRTDELGGQGTP